MNKPAHAILALTGLALPLLAATPYIDGPATIVNHDSRRVDVNYTLSGGPAIVTVDFQTNYVENAETKWASIGGRNYAGVVGDVNHVIEPGQRCIYWNPELSWPNQQVAAGGLRAVVKVFPTNSPPDYLVIDLETGAKTWYADADALPDGGLSNAVYRTDRLVMRRVPAAGVKWKMGNDGETSYHELSAASQHLVTFSSDYYMAVFELTFGQLVKVTGDNYSTRQPFLNAEFKDVRPVVGVRFGELRGGGIGYDWPTNRTSTILHDIDKSFNGKNTILWDFRKLSGLRLDLPTEAQWEYACRAGVPTSLYNGGSVTNAASEDLDGICRYKFNGGYEGGTTEPTFASCSTNVGTAVVGSYAPNRWGLYDMLGNVREWCLDAGGSGDRIPSDYSFEAGIPVTDPMGANGDERRILRGGAYSQEAYICTSAYRETYSQGASTNPSNDIGCRFCWTLVED